MPKAKIICTLVPASSRAAVLRNMMRAGMDVVRLNFSHGSLDDHLERIRLVRQLNKKYRRHIRILGDLEGYRIRIGKLKGGQPALCVEMMNEIIKFTERNSQKGSGFLS